MELECLVKLKREDEFRDLAAALIKGFDGYPQAERAKQLLETSFR